MKTCIMMVVVLVLAVSAQAAAPIMPAAAKAEYDLGNAAFDEKDWDGAVGHFDAARKIDARNPKILFNLGLSHSKAGHELPAIAWLEAYLALVPGDARAADIRKEITRLTAAAESKTSRMLKAARDACDQLQENGSWDGEEKHYLLKSLADAFMLYGDDARALATMNTAGRTLGFDFTAEEELYVSCASTLVGNEYTKHFERTDPDAAAEALDRHAGSVRAEGERMGGCDHWRNVCRAYYHQAGWDGLRKSALKVVDSEERQKWLDLADRRVPPEKRDPCGNWIALAQDLSESPMYTDLEHVLRTTTEKDVYPMTWTRDKGIRAVDATWHAITVARAWCSSLRDVKSVRKFIARPVPKP